MSGIYIPNFNAPECCAKCKLFDEFRGLGFFDPFGYCGVNGNEIFVTAVKNPECPIISISDHGRLIDERDALEAVRKGAPTQVSVDGLSKILFDVPTIIPASE